MYVVDTMNAIIYISYFFILGNKKIKKNRKFISL